MNVLKNKIQQLELKSEEREAQVLEICNLLNTPQPIAPLAQTKYKLKPLLIPHLIEEGVIAVEKLQAIKADSLCRVFLEELVREHYSGTTEVSPTIERLLAAGRTFMILTEVEVEAVYDRLNIAKIVEADKGKPIAQRRYEEWIEDIPQQPVSWAIVNLDRLVGGDEVLQILGELYGY